MSQKSPSFKGLSPSSPRASAAAKGSSRKAGTAHEVLLRRELWQQGLRYRKNVADLPGKPDIVFLGAKVAVFCDGDYWHGKDWEARKAKLATGSNPEYWIKKIERNMERDRQNVVALEAEGWAVIRLWESEIKKDSRGAVNRVAKLLASR